MEKTAWRGKAGSARYKKEYEAVKARAIEEAVEELNRIISVGIEQF